MRGFFDLLVTDEVHEYKGRGSAQGIAAGILADVCGKSLSLDGDAARRLCAAVLGSLIPVSDGRGSR